MARLSLSKPLPPDAPSPHNKDMDMVLLPPLESALEAVTGDGGRGVGGGPVCRVWGSVWDVDEHT